MCTQGIGTSSLVVEPLQIMDPTSWQLNFRDEYTLISQGLLRAHGRALPLPLTSETPQRGVHACRREASLGEEIGVEGCIKTNLAPV